eukprot:gene18144-21696_t
MDDSIALIFNNALQRIFTQSSRKNNQLREACKTAQDTIRDSPIFSSVATTPEARQQINDKEWELLGNKLVTPMRLACETKEPKIMAMALDCLDKLMAYGFIKPTSMDETSVEKKKLIERVVEIIGSFFDYPDENVQIQIIKINMTTAKSALFQMVDSVLQRFEAQSQHRMTASPKSAADESHLYTVHLSDVILLFRAFCKLSTKEVPEGASSDSHEVKSKILSLELLARILENPLPSLKLSEKFINSSIKRYLSVSLLANGASGGLPEFKLTLQLFLSLIIHFKEHLKEEIGIFFSKVLLTTLSSPSSSVKRKWLVLPVLYEICKNPQTIVDIFVNYDCDPAHKDIFDRMVYELSRVAQGTSSGQEGQRTSSTEDAKFKSLGLECIVTIMGSLVDWSKEIYENKRIEQQTRAAIPAAISDEVDLAAINSTPSSPTLRSGTLDEHQRAALLEQGTLKFNASPKKGIDFFIQCNILKEDPLEIATFLKTHKELDLKMVGEYLLLQNPLSMSSLYKYIDSYDFKRMEIDEALTLLFSCILLNGEIQSIDRVVEKFAEKYFHDNPTAVCANAESAYLLSYSIIMLSTDLHNASIKSKLTKEEWLKMNSRSNNKTDFQESYLLDLYDRVSKDSFKLGCPHDEVGFLDSQERLLRFNRESDYIVKQCQELMKSKLSRKAVFYRARNIEHVRPMFLLSWCYVLSTLSVILDDTKDRKLIALCLEGFASAIRVSCIFYLNVERSSFITSLSKLCLLDGIKEPTVKNIECVKHLIGIATTEGNYLQDSWTPILKAICTLERLHLIDTGKGAPSPASSSATSPASFPSVIEYSQNALHNQIKRLVEEYPKDLIFDSIQIERIFTNTVYLSDDSIVTFVRCLCEVSEEEINHYARIYSLIKLVEVIEYNLKRRIRLVFYNIWEIAVSHFTRIGSHQNIEIALHAIDSLRQLASKYMEKEEMSNFNFQNEFLSPFETIMLNNTHTQIRELIIRCISHLILSKAQNIRSGWRTILAVLTIGSRVAYEPIVVLAYQAVEQIIHFSYAFVEEHFFINTVHAIASFAAPSVHFQDICTKALYQLESLSQKVIASSPSPAFSPKVEAHLLPIIVGLTTPIAHENENVRALLLNNLGDRLSAPILKQIINDIVLRIFKVVDYQKKTTFSDFEYMWTRQTCPSVLSEIINLFATHHKSMGQFYPSLIDLFENFICNINPPLSLVGCEYMCKFIERCGQYFTNDQWLHVSETIARIISHLLLKEKPTSPITFLFADSSLVGKRLDDATDVVPGAASATTSSSHNWNVVVVLLQKMTTALLANYAHISRPLCVQIIKYWATAYRLAKSMPTDESVAESSPMHGNSGHNTLIFSNQSFETATLSCLLTFLFEMYLNGSYPDRQTESEGFLNDMVAIVRQVTEGFSKYQDQQFKKHFASLFPHLIEMSMSENFDVRTCLLTLFNRFGREIPPTPVVAQPEPIPLEPVANIPIKQKLQENASSSILYWSGKNDLNPMTASVRLLALKERALNIKEISLTICSTGLKEIIQRLQGDILSMIHRLSNHNLNNGGLTLAVNEISLCL